MISRTFASVFPRQSPSSLILSSINAEADSSGTGLFMYNSNSRAYFSRAQRNLQPTQVEGLALGRNTPGNRSKPRSPKGFATADGCWQKLLEEYDHVAG